MLSKVSDLLLETYLRADTPKPGDATQPPGFDKVTDLLGQIKWLCLAACISAVMIVAVRLSYSRRQDDGEPLQVGKIILSVILISAAGALVGFFAS